MHVCCGSIIICYYLYLSTLWYSSMYQNKGKNQIVPRVKLNLNYYQSYIGFVFTSWDQKVPTWCSLPLSEITDILRQSHFASIPHRNIQKSSPSEITGFYRAFKKLALSSHYGGTRVGEGMNIKWNGQHISSLDPHIKGNKELIVKACRELIV